MKVLVAGVGNIFLGDDGFGPEVVRVLAREQLPVGVHMVDYGIGGLHLAYDLLESWDALVLIDALPVDPQNDRTGAVEVFEVNRERVCRAVGFDAHSVDPNSVFGSLQTLGGTMPRTFVVGARTQSVDEGIGLTPQLQTAVAGAAAVVLGLVRSMTADAATAGQEV